MNNHQLKNFSSSKNHQLKNFSSINVFFDIFLLTKNAAGFSNSSSLTITANSNAKYTFPVAMNHTFTQLMKLNKKRNSWPERNTFVKSCHLSFMNTGILPMKISDKILPTISCVTGQLMNLVHQERSKTWRVEAFTHYKYILKLSTILRESF